MEATFIIPPSVDIRMLSRYAGFAGDDPLCEPAPSFYRVENLLTLDDDGADEFRSLNVWLEATVSKLRFPRPRFLFFVLSFSLSETERLFPHCRVARMNTKSSHGIPTPSRRPADRRLWHSRPRIPVRVPFPLCTISACALRAPASPTSRALRCTSKRSRGTSRHYLSSRKMDRQRACSRRRFPE